MRTQVPYYLHDKGQIIGYYILQEPPVYGVHDGKWIWKDETRKVFI